MTKFSPLLCALVMVACAKDHGQRLKRSRQVANTTVGMVKSGQAQEIKYEELPDTAKNWNADVYLVNFDSTQEEKIHKAVKLIKKVISSKEFRERVINYEYQGKRQFHDNGGLTNEQVYEVILAGAEQMGNTARNNIMDVELELYNQSTNTIGYTYPNTVRIWMNRKYFDRYTPINVADNLMHEWMHKLGFEHSTVWSESRDHSVPYAIGYLVEELAKQYQ